MTATFRHIDMVKMTYQTEKLGFHNPYRVVGDRYKDCITIMTLLLNNFNF